MILKQFLVALVLFLNVLHVFAAGMSHQQADALAYRASRQFENGNRAIQIGDMYTACLEGREALRLISQIDRMDVAPAQRASYDQALLTMIGVVKTVNKYC